MEKGITVRLTGVNVPETTRALATRLVELGRKVEVIEPAHADRLGGDGGASLVCRLLSRNGVVVLARENWAAPSVVVEGYLVAGNLDEPAKTPGLASFVVSMLSRGGAPA